jgi:hypothetical protein
MRAQVLLAVGLCACGSHVRQNPGGNVDAATSAVSQGTGGGDGGDTGEQGCVYAHTASTLYRVDPDTLAVSMVGDFAWPNGPDQMTDIAIDKNGLMIGVSFGSVYRVDPTNAQATQLSSSLGGSFNGLSFVPAAELGQTGDDVLVGTDNSDGKVYRVDTTSGAASPVGDMGAGYTSSGDIVSIANYGTVQTVPGSSSDVLAKLAPNTFTAMSVGTGTGFSQIWGIAYWKNKVYGFTAGGDFVLIDPNTGVGTLVSHSGIAWWGAAVTTLAPVIQ